MRKHHYELIAKAMRESKPDCCGTGDECDLGSRWGYYCRALASALATQDPNFNRELFMKECSG